MSSIPPSQPSFVLNVIFSYTILISLFLLLFFGVIFLVVVLGVTINTLIYNNPVQTGTSLISIDYKTFAPIQLHSLLDVLCYRHTNSIFIHYKPFNSFTFITLCGFLLNQNYYNKSTVMDWMFASPPNPLCRSLNNIMMVFGSWAYGKEVIRFR